MQRLATFKINSRSESDAFRASLASSAVFRQRDIGRYYDRKGFYRAKRDSRNSQKALSIDRPPAECNDERGNRNEPPPRRIGGGRAGFFSLAVDDDDSERSPFVLSRGTITPYYTEDVRRRNDEKGRPVFLHQGRSHTSWKWSSLEAFVIFPCGADSHQRVLYDSVIYYPCSLYGMYWWRELM